MNWNLARKTINDRWKSTAVYAAGLAAYTLMMTAIFPTFRDFEGMQELIEQYPENLFRAFGVEKMDFSSFNNYVTVEFLGLILVIIVGAYVFAFARSIMAGELREGTMELLLVQPVERWQVLTSKGAVLLGGIVSLVLIVVISVFAFGSAFNVGVTYVGYLAFWPMATAMFVAIAGYTLLLTVVTPRKGIMAAVGVTLGFYVMNIAASAVGSIDKLKYFTIFHYYDPIKYLDSGSIDVLGLLVLLGFGLACFAVGIWLFSFKDITY